MAKGDKKNPQHAKRALLQRRDPTTGRFVSGQDKKTRAGKARQSAAASDVDLPGRSSVTAHSTKFSKAKLPAAPAIVLEVRLGFPLIASFQIEVRLVSVNVLSV